MLPESNDNNAITRREMIKTTALVGGAVLLATHGKVANAQSHPTGGVFDPPSPEVTNPFSVELPRMTVKNKLPGGSADLSLPINGGVLPNGTVYPQVEAMMHRQHT